MSSKNKLSMLDPIPTSLIKELADIFVIAVIKIINKSLSTVMFGKQG